MTQSGLAVDIGANQGAINRELARNMGFCGYRFLLEHRFAVQKGLARKGVALVMTPCLAVRAETLLRDNQWSPQQIWVHSTAKTAKKSVMKALIGVKNRSAITSMVERKTKFPILVLLDRPTPEATEKVLNAAEILHSQ